MKELLGNLKNDYDHIIIDSAPILVLSEAKVLSRLADGTVLVFNADVTRRGTALRSIRELREIKAHMVGSILVSVKAMKGGYYHEQFKTYQRYQEAQLTRTV